MRCCEYEPGLSSTGYASLLMVIKQWTGLEDFGYRLQHRFGLDKIPKSH
jgi:hypothetical protein